MSILNRVHTQLPELFVSYVLLQFSWRTCTQSACSVTGLHTDANSVTSIAWGLQKVAHRRSRSFLLHKSCSNCSATFYTSQQNTRNQAVIGNLSVGIAFLKFTGIILYHIWKHTSLSKRLEELKACCKRNRPQSPHAYDSSSDSCSDDSGGMRSVELQPLVLEFDHYREPVLRYADSD